MICKEMGWTWQDYASQPVWFLEEIEAYMEAENSAHAELQGKPKWQTT